MSTVNVCRVDLNGEKQNETGYELSRETFAVTDFTRHNLMDGAVSAGNDLEVIQTKRLNVSRRVCLTSPCILSSFSRRHWTKKQRADKEGNISYKSISRNPIVSYFYPLPPLRQRVKKDYITKHKHPTTVVSLTDE